MEYRSVGMMFVADPSQPALAFSPNGCGDGTLNQRVLSHTFAAAGFRRGVTSHAH
jgi:hypothetical protein